LFFLSQGIMPHLFPREAVSLNSQGCAENSNFFLRNLNSLSLLGECAKGQENARNKIQCIWRKRLMKRRIFGECGE
jgi:hypothetical protein